MHRAPKAVRVSALTGIHRWRLNCVTGFKIKPSCHLGKIVSIHHKFTARPDEGDLSEAVQTQEANLADKPAYDACTVIDRGRGKKGYWLKIGAAFAHEDGKGFNIELNAFPIDGKIVLREPLPPKDEEAETPPVE